MSNVWKTICSFLNDKDIINLAKAERNPGFLFFLKKPRCVPKFKNCFLFWDERNEFEQKGNVKKVQIAAKLGHLNCLKYLHSRGHPLEEIHFICIRNNYWNCFKYSFSHDERTVVLRKNVNNLMGVIEDFIFCFFG